MSAHLRQAWAALQTKASGTKLYHLTGRDNFKLDPKFHPHNNTTIGGDWPEPGIFVTDTPEHWCNGYGYWQPWVVEFDVPSGVGKDYYGRETFIPATEYDRIRITRVLPLDAYCREDYGDWGWTEDHFGTDFETGEPLPKGRPPSGWRYQGDARNKDAAWKAAYKKRVKAFARTRHNAIASKTAARIEKADSSPLDYNRRVNVRLTVVEDGAGPPPSKHPYFTEPDVVAFADLYAMTNLVMLLYLAVRPDQKGQGHARALVEDIYRRFPTEEIHWGKLMHPAMGKLYKEFQKREPRRTVGGSVYY